MFIEDLLCVKCSTRYFREQEDLRQNHLLPVSILRAWPEIYKNEGKNKKKYLKVGNG